MKKVVKATILIILTIVLAIMFTSCSQMDTKTMDDIATFLIGSFVFIGFGAVIWACWEASKSRRNDGED